MEIVVPSAFYAVVLSAIGTKNTIRSIMTPEPPANFNSERGNPAF
jgi:hypothetical protein